MVTDFRKVSPIRFSIRLTFEALCVIRIDLFENSKIESEVFDGFDDELSLFLELIIWCVALMVCACTITG